MTPWGCQQVVGIDPGVAGCGVSVFELRSGVWELTRAAYVRNTRSKRGETLEDADNMSQAVLTWVSSEGFFHADRALLEFPQVYRAGRGKAGADPNDLLTLAAIDGAITRALAGPHCEVSSVLPRAWKATMGELPDGTYLPEQRIMGISEGEAGWVPGTGILTPAEVERVETCARTLFHNVVDGIGIGLHAVGRGLVNGRRRVIAR